MKGKPLIIALMKQRVLLKSKAKSSTLLVGKAMNIDGLGPETVDMFYRLGLIQNTADLYKLTADDIKGLDRMGEKSAENIITGIAQSKDRSF